MGSGGSAQPGVGTALAAFALRGTWCHHLDVGAAGSEVEVVHAVDVDDAVRARAEQILRRHGRACTSFQTLGAGFSYLFSADAYVAFRAIGHAWVAAGAPIADESRGLEVALDFVREARAQKRRPSFFCVDAGFPDADELARLDVGEEPFYEPAHWEQTLRARRSLREQLRRARAKGVVVTRASAEEVAEGAPLRSELSALAERWLAGRKMAPMTFLVQVEPFTRAESRAYFVARRAGEVVGLLVAVPVYAADGYLVEHAFRDASAPNGTVELLFDAAIRGLGEEGAQFVSAGLCPLSGAVLPVLKTAARLGQGLYNFEGLHAFKAKLGPDRWQPARLLWPRRTSPLVAMLDTLRAFTPGGFTRFAIDTLRHLRRSVLRALYLPLVIWTLAVAVAPERFFPWPSLRWIWVSLDLLLVLLLAGLVRRPSERALTALVWLSGFDALLSVAHVALWIGPRAEAALDLLGLVVGLVGPTSAFILLSVLRGRRRRVSV
ncbi:MAG: DUF2156 domain-containing protein [Deltaproteobacteria bacterium]|nr:DUF2156 domain-containing protein [Deltaproteobacteria bacterium]